MRLLTVSILIIGLLLVSCEHDYDSESPSIITDENILPDIFFTNVDHIYCDENGNRVWQIIADREECFNEKNVIYLYNFKYTEFKGGNPKRICSGNNAIVYNFSNTSNDDFLIEIFGNAFVKEEESGDTLETEQLNLNNKTGKFTSDEKVFIYRKTGTIEGKGMIIDKNLQNLQLKKLYRETIVDDSLGPE